MALPTSRMPILEHSSAVHSFLNLTMPFCMQIAAKRSEVHRERVRQLSTEGWSRMRKPCAAASRPAGSYVITKEAIS